MRLTMLSPSLRGVLDYWASRRGDESLPDRKAIDPVDLREYLSDICLIDVVDEGGIRRFKYRLVGTHVVDLMGQDFTGQFFDTFLPRNRLIAVTALYDACVTLRKPGLSIDSMPVSGREFLIYKRLLLPLASDGENVDILLAAFDFVDRSATR